MAAPAPLLLGTTLLLVAALIAPLQTAIGCDLHSPGGLVTHVINIQLDNVHLRRDNPNVPSDLEQMPHLLNFLDSDGVVSANHHASPLTNKSTDVLTILTGLYGDRTGVPIADNYGYFRSDGSVGFASSFGYWTAIGADGQPLMLAETGKIVPAPWVPFTRAGCDVGSVATADLALQTLKGDVASVFGANSPEARAAASDPARTKAGLLGIAIHCARGSPLCANTRARPDVLPDEPGGYVDFNALFGDRYVQPEISPGGPVKDINGTPIADTAGTPGLPTDPTASQSLGYAATMLEAGVSVIYVAIGDAHGESTTVPRAWGPGASQHLARLAADDAAFAAFFERLAGAGITKLNTLFVVTSADNEDFVGGPPTPPDCDGVTTPCTYGLDGDIDTFVNRLLATERHNVTAFDIAFGNAPSFYIHGNPVATDPLTRTLQQDVSKLTVINPITNKSDKLAALLADRAAMRLLHLIPASPSRVPSFIMFGDPNYFDETTPGNTDCALPPPCTAANPDFAWAHADVQQLVGHSWFGMAGPGVAHLGQTADILSDHADLRPTMLALVGLTDSFVHDGIVLAQALDPSALPPELSKSRETFLGVARAYHTLNDPLGQLSRNSLVLATQAIKGSDTVYQRYLDAIGTITAKRDAIAGRMKALLDDAAFMHRPIHLADARALIESADTLINEVEDLAGGSIGPAHRPREAANGDR